MITFPNDSPWEYSFTSNGNQKKKIFFSDLLKLEVYLFLKILVF